LTPTEQKFAAQRRTAFTEARRVHDALRARLWPGVAANADSARKLLDAELLASLVHRAGFHVAPGPAPQVAVSAAGPSDMRLGYSGLPAAIQRLEGEGFMIDAQARHGAAVRAGDTV
jgi:hypothetical protein